MIHQEGYISFKVVALVPDTAGYFFIRKNNLVSKQKQPFVVLANVLPSNVRFTSVGA